MSNYLLPIYTLLFIVLNSGKIEPNQTGTVQAEWLSGIISHTQSTEKHAQEYILIWS